MRFYAGLKYALHNAGICQEVSIGLLYILSTLYSLYEHMKHDEYIHVKYIPKSRNKYTTVKFYTLDFFLECKGKTNAPESNN